MRCEIVAVGTELLLGQIVDTNGAWMGEQLALAGIDVTHRQTVGDNLDRIVDAIGLALSRSDAVIVCGGLGPTQDDITREAIAAVMGVDLVTDDEVADRILHMFAARGRRMPANNLRQALVPAGATAIADPQPGTAPGLLCPVGDKVIYAVPGVPYEMREIVSQAILPDLQRRAGTVAVIRSRTLRTWGESESGLAERLAPRLTELDQIAATAEPGAVAPPTLAFLASGIEGLKVRLTVKATSDAEAVAQLDAEEKVVRGILGDIVFGLDDESMEHAVAKLLVERGLTLAVAESLTGGLVAARLVNVPGASAWFRGGVVTYASELKHTLLDVPEGPVVSEGAAAAMALGVRRVMHADVGLGVTGVAGPDPQEGQRPGTVFLAVAAPGVSGGASSLGSGSSSSSASSASVAEDVVTTMVSLPGDRERIRQFSCISLLDLLRRSLTATAPLDRIL
jgi:nicotinamide-nucleotide amidase